MPGNQLAAFWTTSVLALRDARAAMPVNGAAPDARPPTGAPSRGPASMPLPSGGATKALCAAASSVQSKPSTAPAANKLRGRCQRLHVADSGTRRLEQDGKGSVEEEELSMAG
mmetsp:Transcript_17827/g.56197  ORF Transcript_17827/g.56197 Transcript_17827/m.56197 type:complete len:113 (-) Transcript_17827:44-382(-)